MTKNHELIKLAGYNNPEQFLQSQRNKIYLPSGNPKIKPIEVRVKIAEKLHSIRSLHIGKHKNSVSQNLAEQMNQAVIIGKSNNWTTEQYKKALHEIVSDERKLLKDGIRALNRHKRTWSE